MAVIVLGGSYLDDRVDIEFLLLVHQTVDFHLPWPRAELPASFAVTIFVG